MCRETAGSGLGRTIDHNPAFSLRNRAALFDPNEVASAVAVLLVVRRIFLRMCDELLIHGMYDPAFDANNHCLVASITDDNTL
jgi:hypothetical protein